MSDYTEKTLAALEKTGGDKEKAAELLGITCDEVQRRIYGIYEFSNEWS